MFVVCAPYILPFLLRRKGPGDGGVNKKGLGGEEMRKGPGGEGFDARLIDSSMPVLELVGVAAHRERQELVAKADAEREDVLLQRVPDALDGLLAHLGIPRPVADKNTLVQIMGIKGIKVKVPRHAHNAHAPLEQAAEDVPLDAAIVGDERGDLVYGALGVVRDRLRTTHLRHKIREIRIGNRLHDALPSSGGGGAGGGGLHNAAEHHPMLPQLLRERPRIDPRDPRDVVLLHPVLEGTDRGVVAEPLAHMRADHAPHVDVLALEVLGKPPRVELLARHAVVADERVREREDLPAVAGVRKALVVPRHPRVEDHFPIRIHGCTKRFPPEHSAILQDQGGHKRGKKATCPAQLRTERGAKSGRTGY